MSRNVEVKLKINDWDHMFRGLERLAGSSGQELLQEDRYWYGPRGRLKLRDERQGTKSRCELIHYQRSDEPIARESAYLTCEVIDGIAAREMFTRIYGPPLLVAKCRFLFWYEGNIRLHLDKVDGLADSYLEIEVVLADHDSATAAKSRADALLVTLGLNKADAIAESYEQLIRHNQKEDKSSLRIAVLSGGTTTEAEVSRSSGTAVEQALRKSFQQVSQFEVGPDLCRRLEEYEPDVVFPLTHGWGLEGGEIQGLLEVMNLPYVGSAVSASAFAMDKAKARVVFRDADFPVAKGFVCNRDHSSELAANWIADKAMAQAKDWVVKPARQGSGLGLSICSSRKELLVGMRRAFAIDDVILLEERFFGKEVSIAVLGDPPQALPPCEIIIPEGAVFDYAHRYSPGLSVHRIPAAINEKTRSCLEHAAVSAHTLLGCRHYSRSDFMVAEDGSFIILETNTIPGMTDTSIFPDCARSAGISFEDLVANLVQLAADSKTD